ncbi:diphthine synthase [Ferroplasma sp.]|uniref:diphthine synthase n=1 Tax=Ferroplasma sp. TaxID=2591003 RepID=UPI00307D24B5
MLNIMGLGLRGVKSLTLEEEKVIKGSDIIYFETYTSISPNDTFNSIAAIANGDIKIADRSFVETDKEIIDQAKEKKVTFLVTGDALSATTHNELRMEAIKAGVSVEIYENASIITAFPSRTGLFNYKFGTIVSMPFIHKNFFPVSVYDKIYTNYSNNMHTLLLLDLEDGKTMPVYEALSNLVKMEARRGKQLIKPEMLIIAGTGIASANEKIIYGTLERLIELKPVGSPSSIIIPSKMNDMECSFLNAFCRNID